MLPSIWIQIGCWFQLSNQVISTLFIVLQIPVRQHVSNDLEMPAKSCFMGTNMTCPNIPNPLSRLHALRRCRFILIQKWILKTIAEQNKTINKKRLTDRRWKGSVESKKGPIEIGPKLRCVSILSMHSADMFHLAKL